MRPYNLLFLQFAPADANVLATGLRRTTLTLDLSNTLILSPQAAGAPVSEEDTELQRVCWIEARGTGLGELEVSVPLLWRNGGFMDPILRAWHRFFGLKAEHGASDLADFRSVVRLTASDGSNVVQRGPAAGLGDISVTLKRALTDGAGRLAVAARAGVKIPSGSASLLLGSGAVDLGLSLDAQYRLGREFMTYANLSGALLGRARRVPQARRTLLQGFWGLEYRPNSRDSYHWQLEVGQAPIRTGYRFADSEQATVTFGYRRVLSRTLIISGSFSENGDYANYATPLLGRVGPDFTASLGLEWRP